MLQVAESLVDGLWDGLNRQFERQRPVDSLLDIATSMGASVRIVDDMPEDGRLRDSPRSTQILLRRRVRAERRRFTLAHELAHTVLNEPGVYIQAQTILNDEVDLEDLCDAFAAELLMPRQWVKRCFSECAEGFDVIDEVMRTAAVSLSAAVNRLVIVLGWQNTMFFFHRDREWAPVAIAGPQGRLSGLELVEGMEEVLLRSHRGWSFDGRPIRLTKDGVPVHLYGTVRPSPGGVLCLGRLRPRRNHV